MKQYSDFKGSGIPVFAENSRVCFLGDSLTCGGLWPHIIFDYYLKAFPKGNIRIYDCGVGQGTAAYGRSTLADDVYTYDPTHVVIMYGANDINCASGTPMNRMNSFYRDMKALTEELLSKGIVVYYMSEPACETEIGEVIRIRELANSVVQTLTAEYGTYCCDLYSAFSPLLTREMLESDLVHFNPLGDSVLARVFLHTQGFDGFTPADEGFFDLFRMSYDLDHRKIFSDKIRSVMLAMRSISTTGDTAEAKIERLKARIKTRADGAWDDFCYYRAVDFIERYPLMSFYRELLDTDTDKMIADAMSAAE